MISDLLSSYHTGNPSSSMDDVSGEITTESTRKDSAAYVPLSQTHQSS